MASNRERQPLLACFEDDEEQNCDRPIASYSSISNDDQFTTKDENSVKLKSKSPITYFLGILLVILAGCAFTAANVIQKIICPSLSFWSLMLIRSLIQMTIMAVYMIYRRKNFLPPKEVSDKDNPNKIIKARNTIFLQGFFGGLLLLAIFVAVKNVPLGDVSAIIFCTPVATFVFAIFMLDERLGCYRVMISILMISGVILIARPNILFPVDQADTKNGTNVENDAFSDHSCVVNRTSNDYQKHSSVPYGYIAAIFVPIFSAIVSIWTRQCRQARVDASVLMFWFATGAFTVALGGLAASRGFATVFDLNYTQIIYTLSIVALGMIGNASYTYAVSWVSPSKANVFRSFEVILNYVLDLVLLSMKYHSLDVVGIVLLIFAVIATGFEEEVKFRVKSTTDALTTARNYSPNSINRIYLAILSKI